MKALLILFFVSYLATWVWGGYSFMKNKGKVGNFYLPFSNGLILTSVESWWRRIGVFLSGNNWKD